MRKIAAFAFWCLSFSTLAVEVSKDEATLAVGNWLATDAALGCSLGRAVSASRTGVTPGGARFHVLQLDGGGFVVTSADTTLEPVVAFSSAGDFSEDDRGPLWALLCSDLDAAAPKAASRVRFAAAPSVAEEKWAKLLTPKPLSRLRLAAARESVSDVRIAPLLKTTWGQTTAGGRDCYNLLTPKCYYTGCVATAGAQIMRYFEWPQNPIAAFTNAYCTVDGTRVALTGEGGLYDWAKMPLHPDGATTDAERLAIARLMRDLGVACGMDYESNGSAVGSYMLQRAWTTVFGYASAQVYTLSGDLPLESVKRALISNLDARLPVELGITGANGGHAIVGDGYGYSDGTLYFHFNFGWEGSSDAWYAPPQMSAGGYSFTAVSTLVYNIFPAREGSHTIVSGRVLDAKGRPVAGAKVKSVDFWNKELETTTDAKGIYALVVPSAWYYQSLPYDLTAEYEGVTSEVLSLKVRVCYSTVVNEDGTYLIDTSPAPTVSNLIDQNLVLPIEVEEQPPDPEPEVPEEPEEVPEGTLIGDPFAYPIRLTGASGEYLLDDTAKFSKEPDEPLHSLQNGRYYPEARSAWFRWTAPGGGEVTFRASSRRKVDSTTYILHAMIAAYQGEELATAKRIALFDGLESDDSTAITLTVTQGEAYRIVVFAYANDPMSGPYALSWQGNLTVLPTTTQTTDVPVPHAWIKAHYPHVTDFETCALGRGANGRPVWESYLLGLDPTSPLSDLRIVSFRLLNGEPVVEWNVTNRDIRALGYDYRLKELDSDAAKLYRLVVEPTASR